MTGLDAMRAAVRASGKSGRAVAVECGRSPNFISATFAQGARPTGETLALIGHACGYRLALVPSEYELPSGALEIEPA